MKKGIKSAVLFVGALFVGSTLLGGLGGCGTSIDGQSEGVVVKKPLCPFCESGVMPEPVSTGWVWHVFTTAVYPYNLVPFQASETFTNLVPAGNTPVNFDAHVRLQIQQGKSPILHKDFGVNVYINNVQKVFRAIVREEASKYGMWALVSDKTSTVAIQAVAQTRLQEYLDGNGIPLTVVAVEMGKVEPPEQVLAETSLTAAQIQRTKTETEKALAELARAEAEQNRALADKAYMDSLGLSPTQYIRLRTIEIMANKENLNVVMGLDNIVLPTK